MPNYVKAELLKLDALVGEKVNVGLSPLKTTVVDAFVLHITPETVLDAVTV